MPLKLGEYCRTLRRFVCSSTGRWWAALLGRKCQSATEYTAAAAPPDRDQKQEGRVCKNCVMKHEPFLNGASVAVSRPACPLCRIQRILLRASHLPTWDRDSKSKSLSEIKWGVKAQSIHVENNVIHVILNPTQHTACLLKVQCCKSKNPGPWH